MKYCSWAFTPDPETWVHASYEDPPEIWTLVKTCKLGCCVTGILGQGMILPRYWRETTEKEAADAQHALATGPKLDVDVFDLYE